MEAIQLANTKIDEIRTEFSRWLLEQSSEFKERLAKRYNETFNCFVRPQYNGAHQDFPVLHRETLGIKDLYPSQKDAKILYPGKEDFTPQKRLRIFGDIKNNDWDCVILTHDQFKMIPQSPEVQQSILQEELQDVEESLWQLEKQGSEVSRAMIKGMYKRKENLEVKLKTLEHDIN